MKIVRISPEPESAHYASQIIAVIGAAGWKVGQPEIPYPVQYYNRYRTGITILVNNDEPQSSLVKFLSDAFKAARISHALDTTPMYEDRTEIVLIIGTKG